MTVICKSILLSAVVVVVITVASNVISVQSSVNLKGQNIIALAFMGGFTEAPVIEFRFVYMNATHWPVLLKRDYIQKQ